MRVHEYAKEQGIKSKELKDILKNQGFAEKHHSAKLSEEENSFLKKHFAKEEAVESEEAGAEEATAKEEGEAAEAEEDAAEEEGEAAEEGETGLGVGARRTGGE